MHPWFLGICSLASAAKRSWSQASAHPAVSSAIIAQNGVADFSLHRAFQANTSLPTLLLHISTLNLGLCMASMDCDGRTPLHYLPAWACSCSVGQSRDPDTAKATVIRMLYEASDRAIDQADSLGRTALHYAMGVDKLSTSVLVHLGARGEVGDVHGRWAVNMPGSFSPGEFRCMLQERKLLETKIMAIILATAVGAGSLLGDIPREIIMVVMVQMMQLNAEALAEQSYDGYYYQPATLPVALELVKRVCLQRNGEVFHLPENVLENISGHFQGPACIRRKLF